MSHSWRSICQLSVITPISTSHVSRASRSCQNTRLESSKCRTSLSTPASPLNTLMQASSNTSGSSWWATRLTAWSRATLMNCSRTLWMFPGEHYTPLRHHLSQLKMRSIGRSCYRCSFISKAGRLAWDRLLVLTGICASIFHTLETNIGQSGSTISTWTSSSPHCLWSLPWEVWSIQWSTPFQA